MLSPLPTLSAYRADLDRHGKRARVAEFDGVWIIIARAVEQFLELDRAGRAELRRALGTHLVPVIEGASAWPDHHREPLAALARTLRDESASEADATLFDAVVRVAENMEGSGALHLAFTLLAHLRAASPRVDAGRHGLALSIQGRIAREMGDLDSAAELYGEASALAVEHNDHQTASLVAHGLGGIALARGNLPNARVHYESALQHAQMAGVNELEGRAHRGLLIVAAKEGDLDAALSHGWEAYQRSSGDRNGQAEFMCNLAGLCRESGHYAASFAGYSLAVLWSDMERVRMPAMGGAALAAALSGDAHHVKVLVSRIEHGLTSGVQPFETAQGWLDLASACEIVGDSRATTFAARAETISTTHRYYELQHLARELLARSGAEVRKARAPLDLSTSASRVVASVTALAHETSSISALVGTTG